MIQVANSKCRDSVAARLPFRGSNLYGNTVNKVYVVYSYGVHFPLYIHDPEVDRWFGNSNYVSRTTARHKTQANPHVSDMLMFPTDIMKQIAAWGFVDLCKRKIL